MNLKRKNERRARGITLIALVITIIILLILAGVSIATLTGDNGILKKAQTAKDETQEASEEEQRQLAILKASMNTKNYDYPVEDGKVTIPAGFAPTGIEGENSIKEGVVVVDEKGNEFVWIPVEDESKYIKNQDYMGDGYSIDNDIEDDKGYLPEGIENEKQIVVNAKGFYISRYEAGAEGGKLENNRWTEEPTLVSKKGKTVWNCIPQEECKTKSKEFVNNEDVKSALISGTQWDVVMKFINGKLDGNNKKFDVLQMDKSRHTGIEARSGQNEADKVCNIYDLEGNYVEVIAEKNKFDSQHPYIFRGGYYGGELNYSASYRGTTEGSFNTLASFRLVLYVFNAI